MGLQAAQRLILAPLQGVTEYPFRTVWLHHFSGLDEAVSPFLPAVTGQHVKSAHLRDVLPVNQEGAMALVPQVMGNRAEEILRTSEALASLGYCEVNLNMGCPSSTVTKKMRGCGLMPHPTVVDELLRKLIPSMPVPLSVKVRLGMYEKSELLPLLEHLNQYPLSRIIVHPRLGIQHYKGKPDLEAFEEIAKRTPHQVVYNGDINTTDNFLKLQQRFPHINQWMLGRGVLMNPFLPGMIKGIPMPPRDEAKLILKSFYLNLMEAHLRKGMSPSRYLAKTKEYWYYFSNWFKYRDQVWYSISRTQDRKELDNAIDEAFGSPSALFL
jgi:tRNA-dihydrouridine synthase B